MKLTEVSKIKEECYHKQKHTMEGSDCSECPLADKVNLKLAVQSYGPWEDGDVVLPVSPCLLLEELLPLIKKKERV